MRILLIRFSSIGDIVLTSAAIRCLRKSHPDARIDFLTKPAFAPILKNNPHLTDVMEWKDDLWAAANEIISRQYDLIIDWHNNLRSNLLIQLLPEGMEILRYPKMSLKRGLSVLMKRNHYGDGHVVDQFLVPLKRLGVSNDGLGLEFFISPEDKITSKDLPLTHFAGYAVFCLGATHFTKRWPVESWAELCRDMRMPIILVGGKSEAEQGGRLAAIDPYKIINRCGVYSLGQSASVIQQAKLVVTHDTGMMHIAAAFNKRTISIWGGTVPWMGFGPFHLDASKSILLQNESLSCRPCSKYGRSSCPKGHFKCMKDITAQQVIEASGVGL